MRLWWLAPEEQNGPPPTYQLERKEPSLSAPSAPMMRGTRFIGHGYYKFPSSTHPVNTDFTGKCPWRHFLYEALSPTVFSVILIIFYNGFDSACLWRFSCSPFITLAWWGQHIYLFSILGEKKKIEGKWKKEKKKKNDVEKGSLTGWESVLEVTLERYLPGCFPPNVSSWLWEREFCAYTWVWDMTPANGHPRGASGC